MGVRRSRELLYLLRAHHLKSRFSTLLLTVNFPSFICISCFLNRRGPGKRNLQGVMVDVPNTIFITWVTVTEMDLFDNKLFKVTWEMGYKLVKNSFLISIQSKLLKACTIPAFSMGRGRDGFYSESLV